MDWHLLWAQIVAGLANGALYFLVASGLSLMWGALGVVNVAHGSFFMVAAFATATCIKAFGPGAGLLIALVIVPSVVALAAMGIEITLFRRTYASGVWGQLLLSFGLLLAINDLCGMAFGMQPVSVPAPAVLSGGIEVAGLTVARYQLAVFVATALVALFLWRVLNASKTGRLIRAAVDDPAMLEAVGIDVRWLRTKVMGIAAVLAALAGVITAPRDAIHLKLDVDTVVVAFAVIVIGGLGSVWGALAAALLIGVAEAASTIVVDQGGEVVIFAVMVAVLIVRPTGFKTIVGRG
jgi:branched-subunit amino acid ABC-type transport system permease component